MSTVDEFRKALRRDFMFFKHADRDTDHATQFPPFITVLFIVVTIETLRALDEQMSDRQMVFTSWMALFAPDLVNSDFKAEIDRLPVEYRTFVSKMTKREFFEYALQGYADARATKGNV